MGSYGIGPSRLVAAIIEASHDEQRHHLAGRGRAVRRRAPQPEDRRRRDGRRLRRALSRASTAAGVDVLYDDRDERPGAQVRDRRPHRHSLADRRRPEGPRRGQGRAEAPRDRRARSCLPARRRRRAADDRRRVTAAMASGATATDARPFAPFEWMLAGRYLRTRRREGFVSVIAGFSFLGIMLGVATLIVVLSVMNGFRKELLDKIVGINGHIFVAPIDTPADRLRRGRRAASRRCPACAARSRWSRARPSAPRNTTAAASSCAACAART